MTTCALQTLDLHVCNTHKNVRSMRGQNVHVLCAENVRATGECVHTHQQEPNQETTRDTVTTCCNQRR